VAAVFKKILAVIIFAVCLMLAFLGLYWLMRAIGAFAAIFSDQLTKSGWASIAISENGIVQFFRLLTLETPSVQPV